MQHVILLKKDNLVKKDNIQDIALFSKGALHETHDGRENMHITAGHSPGSVRNASFHHENCFGETENSITRKVTVKTI